MAGFGRAAVALRIASVRALALLATVLLATALTAPGQTITAFKTSVVELRAHANG